MNVSGVVQGVGFRWWCMRTADEYNLPGYVANLPDGSVEIEVEGDKGLIEDFIKAVRVGPTYAHVTDLKLDWNEQPKGYEDFDIRHAGW